MQTRSPDLDTYKSFTHHVDSWKRTCQVASEGATGSELDFTFGHTSSTWHRVIPGPSEEPAATPLLKVEIKRLQKEDYGKHKGLYGQRRSQGGWRGGGMKGKRRMSRKTAVKNERKRIK